MFIPISTWIGAVEHAWAAVTGVPLLQEAANCVEQNRQEEASSRTVAHNRAGLHQIIADGTIPTTFCPPSSSGSALMPWRFHQRLSSGRSPVHPG